LKSYKSDEKDNKNNEIRLSSSQNRTPAFAAYIAKTSTNGRIAHRIANQNPGFARFARNSLELEETGGPRPIVMITTFTL
jgi:hypothetical protein